MYSLAFDRSAVDAILGGIDRLTRAGSIRSTREIERALLTLSIAYLFEIRFAEFGDRMYIPCLRSRFCEKRFILGRTT